MATETWVNIGSGNGLLPDGTKPLLEPMLTYHQKGLVAFIWGQFHEIPQPPFIKVSLKITYLKLNWNLPGVSELSEVSRIRKLHEIIKLTYNLSVVVLAQYFDVWERFLNLITHSVNTVCNNAIIMSQGRCYLILNWYKYHLDGLVQDYGDSSANALELPQSCTKSWTTYIQYILLILFSGNHINMSHVICDANQLCDMYTFLL